MLFYFGTGYAPVTALTWFAPLPVLLLAPRVPGWTAVGAAFFAYLLGTGNTWVLQLRSHDTPMWPVGIMIDVGCSLIFVVAVWGFRLQVVRRRVLLATITAPALWTGLFYVVSVSNPMGLEGTFANTMGDVPLLLQTASVTGMWGVEFIVLLVPSAVAALLAPAVPAWARVRVGAVAGVVLAVALGGGALRLSGEQGPVQRVAAVASNQRVWAPDLATPAGRDLVAAYADQIAGLPNGVGTVVLPEQSFRSTEALPAVLVEPMSRVARQRGIDIVIGFAHWDRDVKYNYALIFLARGGDPVVYLKHHDTVSPPGHELIFAPIAGVRAGVEICLDLNLANPTRDYAAAGAQLLLVPASDEDDNGWQHSRMALLRGVENGQPIVWSGRTGTLMISDGHGRVLADAHTGGPGSFTTIVADLPTGPGATPYTHLGDWFAWLCLAMALGGLPTLRRRFRATRPEQSQTGQSHEQDTEPASAPLAFRWSSTL
ncbi:nitrilase-related carbon-nitrogen hydrolase [Lentzea sp. NPDC004782]|uniref:nitrilase-related carbon-nitrogen hydrolase n=1 Tax=Lentzea sp. NPDC004782 TaxID=3154458 RepID=UPI0033BBFD64